MVSQPPKYVYTPNDFLTLSVITAILCGIFSPLTLFMSIPAVIISLKVSYLFGGGRGGWLGEYMLCKYIKGMFV